MMESLSRDRFKPSASAYDMVIGRKCLCFTAEDSISRIIDQMHQNHTYAAAVTDEDEGAIIGLLTAQEILIRAAACDMHRHPTLEHIARAFNTMKAVDAMIRHPLTVESDMPLDEAYMIMIDLGYRYLPVIRQGRPLGILNILDVMKYREESARQSIKAKDHLLSYVMSHENYGCILDD